MREQSRHTLSVGPPALGARALASSLGLPWTLCSGIQPETARAGQANQTQPCTHKLRPGSWEGHLQASLRTDKMFKFYQLSVTALT